MLSASTSENCSMLRRRTTSTPTCRFRETCFPYVRDLHMPVLVLTVSADIADNQAVSGALSYSSYSQIPNRPYAKGSKHKAIAYQAADVAPIDAIPAIALQSGSPDQHHLRTGPGALIALQVVFRPSTAMTRRCVGTGRSQCWLQLC